MDESKPILEVQRAHERELMSRPNVVGVGIGLRGDREVIKVFVSRKVAEAELRPEEIVPRTLDRYETDVEEIGVVTAQNG